MIIGFTGTREGMTVFQRLAIRLLLQKYTPTEIHHGMCAGADTEFRDMVEEFDRSIKIIGHPPKNKNLYVESKCHEMLPPLDYLARDRAIAYACSTLVATPKSATEEARSGTWYTIHCARKLGKRIFIIGPSGHVEYEEWKT